MLRPAVCAFLVVSASLAQAPDPQSEPARFEVAAIHPSKLDDTVPSGCMTGNGLVRCSNVTLKRCILGAYRIGADRVLGGPNWIDTERFQITARAAEALGDKPLMAMLQTLLAERFKLVLHRETRRADAMLLEVGRKGPKLTKAEVEHGGYDNMHDHLDASGLSMADFAEILSRDLKLPVIDQTGLAGGYNFTLRWNPQTADALGHEEAAAALRSEISAAIARQLGLTLKQRRMPVEVLVVDSADRPSEN